MVPTQAQHSFRIFLLKFHHQLHATGSIRAAINQVAQKNERVRGFFARKHIKETVKLGGAPVNISDDESFHAVVPSRFSSDALTLCIISLKRGSLCRSVQFGSDSNQR